MNSNFGFVKVATATPMVRVADCPFNIQQIIEMVDRAEKEHAVVVCFPELSVTAYTCQDLFVFPTLLEVAEKALEVLIEHSAESQVIILVGVPVRYSGTILDCAAVVQRGKLLGLVPKSYLNAAEERTFSSVFHVPGGTITYAGQQVEISRNRLFETPHFTFAIEIGNDLWAPLPPSTLLCLKGADVIFNLCAKNAQVESENYLQGLAERQSAGCHAAYVLSNCGYGESTQDMVFGGNACIYEAGACISRSNGFSLEPNLCVSEIDIERLRTLRAKDKNFSANAARYIEENVPVTSVESVRVFDPQQDTLTRRIAAMPFVPKGALLNERCREVFRVQTFGLARRVEHTHARSLVIGISGGLDSTLALLVCVAACDLLGMPRTSVVGVTMPGFGTTDRTYTNALMLMKKLGITMREISIKNACMQHFSDIGHDVANHNITYENSQARERTQILMDVANQCGGFVVGTGDLSELALGWATYNGDHMSMYGVNASVPKTFIRHLVTWIANQEAQAEVRDVLLDIVDTPISPELIPADEQGNMTQKTEDLVGPYELHDFFLYHFLKNAFGPEKIFFLAQQAFAEEYSDETIQHWLRTFCRRFFQQQFKRSCLPDGPKVGSCSLSPRGDWAMPSDAMSTLWLV